MNSLLKTGARYSAALLLASSLSPYAYAEVFEGFAEPVRIIESAAAAEGRIAEVAVKRGDRVQRGDLLVMLDTSILEASLNIAKARAENTAKTEATQVEYELKQQRFDQLANLVKAGAGSPEEVKRARAEAQVAHLNVVAAQQEQQLAALQLAEIEARLEQRCVRSPVDGIVTEVLKEIGEHVSTSNPHVATVVELDQLRLTFYLPTQLAMQIAPGQSLNITFPELSQQDVGKVEYVSQVTQADSGRVRVDVLLDNSKDQSRSGIRAVFDSSQLHATARQQEIEVAR